MQLVPSLTPDMHLSTSPGGGPKLPAVACGERGEGIEALGQEALAQLGERKVGVLHLNALQIDAPQGQPREIEATQVPPQSGEQGDHVGRPIALDGRILRPELREQGQQVCLDLRVCSQFGVQPLAEGMHQQALLDLSHIVLGLGLRDPMLVQQP
jgi:hypothetical protein